MQTEIIELRELAAPKRTPFGEFLVRRHVLDRFQLFRALQLQDRTPGSRIGDCAVALGFVAPDAVEQLHDSFAGSDLETMPTTSFTRA